MTDIQRARDVLAKWRGGASGGPWFAAQEHPEFHSATIANDAFLNPTEGNEHEPVLDVSGISIGDARLMVGTAGNPDLLDAIDLMLHCAQGIQRGNAELVEHAERIAAAIIAADERMSA